LEVAKIAFSTIKYNRMGLKLIEHGSNEYRQMVHMRYLRLRAPLGLTFSDEELAKELDNLLIGAFD